MREITDIELRKCLIDMLVFVDEWCHNNNITYYLAYGTLLGAVRHKGLIPWDDDIDIAMPRKDYELFAKKFNKSNPNNDRYSFVDMNNTPGYYLTFGKVIDHNTLLKEHMRYNVDLGVYIDVFPVDNLDCGNGMLDTQKLLNRIRPYCNLWAAKIHPIHKKRTFLRNVISYLVSLIPISIKKVVYKIDIISRTYQDYPKPDKVGIIVHNIYRGRGDFKYEWVKSTIKMDFEGHKLCVPIGYHELLTRIYGDYMTPPPEKNRVSHHDFEAYVLKE